MTVRTRVNQAGVQSMFAPGGDIYGFGRKVSITATTYARMWAVEHQRTGALAKSFSTSSQVRRNDVRWQLQSSEPHALFLERGTRPQAGKRILYQDVHYGEAPRSRAFPRWQGFIGVYQNGVAGIRATRFMSAALRRAMARHGLV